MRALLLCDDYWHPGEVPIGGVEPLKEKGFTFDILTDARDFKPETLLNYDTVLLSKCDEVSQTDKRSWKTPAVQQAFIDYVENGGGLVVVHTGTVAGDDTQALDNLIGCRFVSHPNNCPVTVQAVKPHPVTEGVEQFIEEDEHYQIELLTPDADILLASYSPPAKGQPWYDESNPYFSSPGALCPAGYVRTQGKGRVCVLTPGHLLAVWRNAQFQRVLENALRWTAAL